MALDFSFLNSGDEALEEMYVISSDQDMATFCDESDSLVCLAGIEKFLDLISAEDSVLHDEVELWFKNNQDFLRCRVEESLNERILRRTVSIPHVSKASLELQEVTLESNVYSVSITQHYVYAYTEVTAVFKSRGVCSYLQVREDDDFSRNQFVDKDVDFEASWTGSREVEIELKRSDQNLEFSGAWVIGDISLEISKASKLFVV